jgi:hypothetical protein
VKRRQIVVVGAVSTMLAAGSLAVSATAFNSPAAPVVVTPCAAPISGALRVAPVDDPRSTCDSPGDGIWIWF